jgi:hypothetical protein
MQSENQTIISSMISKEEENRPSNVNIPLDSSLEEMISKAVDLIKSNDVCPIF